MDEVFIIGASIFILGSVFFVGGTLAVGVMTGLVSSIGLGFLIYKCKNHLPRAWNFLVAHPILSDILLSAMFVLLLNPTTATGLIAGCSASVFSSSGLSLATKMIGRV